ncbi:uncharacterized protein LOC121869608 [Homarus americanus]|uniref:E3 ubiquitin-protein ligase rififylin-like n=1 Tax=Homarus americanus TaxID=6706 RepID=A0A8J5MVQ3_HOMAM|nr:uncharacterized protein LOC121869608 [Homarus americanus]XP_042227007.1 uncharacterized protein LOC121869608 [Homarus americanus]XP_042227008.1 uncharacterized protein LOC121869608 [Homarus americanus]KAG7166220.1 E3 ubiquitin-protein ligase rififylin-like [Homarus americanus]
MLGGGGGCGGPVSWWCSEAWRCSPKVAPDITCAATTATQMADCDQCNAKFSLLKRRRICSGCGLVFCGACIKRGMCGTRKCNKCIVLTQWPLDVSEVTALRVKDLRHFLHSRHINTTACTEKRDLIELVTRHVSYQHRGTGATSRWSVPVNGDNGTTNSRVQTNHKPPAPPRPNNTTRDDGIRVRPSSASPSDSRNMGSIRVRPMDGVRVRPVRSLSPDSNDYDPEVDFGIRVFATERQTNHQQRANSTSPISAEGCSGSVEDHCSHCPSEDCTTSCCSLDSCHNGASSQPVTCPLNVDTSSQESFEDIIAPCEGHLPDTSNTERSRDWIIINAQVEPQQVSETGSSHDTNHTHNSSASYDAGEAATNSSPDTEPSAPPQEEEPPPVTATSSSSASSSTPPSATSSPEPNKCFVPGIIPLGDLKSEEDIRRLSVRQCKELLALHRVNYSGVREKSELLKKIEMLWKDYQNSRQDVEALPEELVCKICMDRAIDCVLLECGHMVACTQCGKQMAECPVCRQYVVRVVHTFRA